MIKLLKAIFFDEAGMGLLSAGLGIFGKSESKVDDPLSPLRGDFQDFLRGRLGKQTPFALDPSFIQTQPGIEKTAEEKVSGRLTSPIVAPKISQEVQRVFEAQKARQALSFEDEREADRARFNRLGLVSSSPGLASQGKISERQRVSEEELSANLALQEIGFGFEGQKFEQDLITQAISDAQRLGLTQRQAQEFAIQTSLEDIERRVREELGFAQVTSGFLGQIKPETVTRPGTAQKIGQFISAGEEEAGKLLKLLMAGG